MAAFDRGDWVKFRDGAGRQRRGHVTSAKGRSVRLVDLEGRQYTTSAAARGEKVPFGSIRAIDCGVVVLDTQLDRRWKHRRESARFWEEYCRHAGWNFGFELVEPALMQLLFETSHSPSKCVEIVREAFEPWKNINVARAKKFPLVCY